MLIELFFGFSCLVLVLHWYFSRVNIFERMGIPGPKSGRILGNLFDIWGKGKVMPLEVYEWTKQYGQTYGFYEGGRPVLVVSDPDFLQQMLVKQFNNFYGRKEFSIQPHPETGGDRVHVFMARGAKWKRLRVISNPAFTSAKIKQMLPSVRDCVNEMLETLETKRKDGTSFDIYSVYQGLTLDVISRVAFAYDSSMTKDPDNGLLTFFLKAGASGKERVSLLVILASVFPSIKRLVYYYAAFLGALLGHPFRQIRDRMKMIIESKREQQAAGAPKRHDFIQMMLDAEADPGELGSNFANGAGSNGKEWHVQKKLTLGEIASQSFVFLFAGFETTSATLACTTYLLATHPEVQEKVLAEIDEMIGSDEDITYDMMKKLPYLDCVVKESLRLYPVAAGAVTREAADSCTINGMLIPKGMNVLVDMWSLHYNENLWGSDAKEFKPERFSQPLPHAYAYMPFGAGPRTCIGMRFALLETKIALCHILKRYAFEECAETVKPLPIQCNFNITVTPKDGVYIKLKERNAQ